MFKGYFHYFPWITCSCIFATGRDFCGYFGCWGGGSFVPPFFFLVGRGFFFSSFRGTNILWQLPCFLIWQDIPDLYHLFLATLLSNISPKYLYYFKSSISKPQSLTLGWYFKNMINATGFIVLFNFLH